MEDDLTSGPLDHNYQVPLTISNQFSWEYKLLPFKQV